MQSTTFGRKECIILVLLLLCADRTFRLHTAHTIHKLHTLMRLNVKRFVSRHTYEFTVLYVFVSAHCSLVCALHCSLHSSSHAFLTLCLVFHVRPHRREVRPLTHFVYCTRIIRPRIRIKSEIWLHLNHISINSAKSRPFYYFENYRFDHDF